MKNISTLLFFVLFVFTTFAQDSKDPKAEAILNSLSAKAKTYKSIEATFSIVQEDLQAEETTEQKGQVKVMGDKYALKLDNFEVYNNGEITWTFDSDMNEATRDLTEDVKDPDSPTFSEMLTLWENGYKYAFESEKTIDGVTYDIINLYPNKDNEKPYHTAKLTIDKNKNEIVKIILIGKDGVNYIYEINSFKVNETFPESTFTFDKSKHPDCDIIDNVM